MFFYFSLKHLKVGNKTRMTSLNGFRHSAISKPDLLFKVKTMAQGQEYRIYCVGVLGKLCTEHLSWIGTMVKPLFNKLQRSLILFGTPFQLYLTSKSFARLRFPLAGLGRLRLYQWRGFPNTIHYVIGVDKSKYVKQQVVRMKSKNLFEKLQSLSFLMYVAFSLKTKITN